MAPIDQYIIDVVREKRKALKMSQDELAERLGVSKGFIGNVESPKYIDKYSTAQINELAKIFECSPRDFLPEDPF
ncbi:helix-turn-helix transcriptional regulator [Chitinophaga sp.]|uniref:helix-turn-helix domain-containing protein n=1 Tax=Chitinophaga sp. TaxID=1869181 RepID=UPI0031D6AE19